MLQKLDCAYDAHSTCAVTASPDDADQTSGNNAALYQLSQLQGRKVSVCAMHIKSERKKLARPACLTTTFWVYTFVLLALGLLKASDGPGMGTTTDFLKLDGARFSLTIARPAGWQCAIDTVICCHTTLLA